MRKIIDLTLPYDEGFPGFSMAENKVMERDGWNASTLTFYSHSGTHMDAPIHFNASKATIDEFPIDSFFGKAWVIDIDASTNQLWITYEMVADQLKAFQPGESLILRTRWSEKLGTPAYRDALPRISDDLANWCVKNKVKMLGVEPPSVADVNNLEEVTRIHQILLGHVIIIEGLSNLEAITANSVELIALPLKIVGGDGSPARVVAIETID